MKAAFVRPPPRDLGVRGASIVRCGLSYERKKERKKERFLNAVPKTLQTEIFFPK